MTDTISGRYKKRHSILDHRRSLYGIRFKRALAVSLLLAICLFSFSRHYSGGAERKPRMVTLVMLTAEKIPVTRQGKINPAPLLPTTIIPVEDEVMPEDETIEDTVFELYDDFAVESVGTDEDELIYRFLPPPDADDLKKAVDGGFVTLNIYVNPYGQVDSVRVLENTSNSQTFENDCIRNAYRTRFLFSRSMNQESGWIQRTYNFNKQEYKPE